MIPRIYADKVNVIVLYWSDNSRNVFFAADKEMANFIEWKQSKEPELTFEHEIMSVTDYKIRYCSPDL